MNEGQLIQKVLRRIAKKDIVIPIWEYIHNGTTLKCKASTKSEARSKFKKYLKLRHLPMSSRIVRVS